MSSVPRYEHAFIDGQWRQVGGAEVAVVDPTTEDTVAVQATGGSMDIERAVSAAGRVWPVWAETPVKERAEVVRRWADVYAERTGEIAPLITREMGSPAWFTAQTDHPLAIMRDMPAIGEQFPWSEVRDGYVLHRRPVGVAACIVPWNMPHKTIVMKTVPALLAGCSVVVKPAPQTAVDATILAETAEAAQVPPGVFNVLPLTDAMAPGLVAYPGIDKIAFTGSTATGRQIAATAAAETARVSLEMGGKSAMVLLDDADVPAAAARLLDDCMLNNGQICSNQTRILVHLSRYAEAVDAFTDAAIRLRVGDPADPATDIGPVVTAAARNRAVGAVHQAMDQDARLTAGSMATLPGRGWFVPPTVLADVSPGSNLFRREVFAPIVGLTPFATDEEAVTLYNATEYGLDGSVWSADTDRARAMATALRTGTVRINGAEPPVTAPIGGFKSSGLGRELGPEGIAAFTEPQVVTDV